MMAPVLGGVEAANTKRAKRFRDLWYRGDHLAEEAVYGNGGRGGKEGEGQAEGDENQNDNFDSESESNDAYLEPSNSMGLGTSLGSRMGRLTSGISIEKLHTRLVGGLSDLVDGVGRTVGV